MKDAIVKRLEIVAYIFMIVASSLVCIVLVKNHLTGKYAVTISELSRVGIAPAAGTKLNLLGVDWKQNRLNIVVVLSTKCRFCEQNGPFYKKVVEYSGTHKDIGIIAAMPQDVTDSNKFLNEMDVHIERIVRVEPSSIGIRATPTLLLVDKNGIVKDLWVGLVTIEKETAVFGALKAN